MNAFCHRIRLKIGGYLAVLGKVDALIFCGGIGENSSIIRSKVCRDLTHIGFRLNDMKNNTINQSFACISSPESPSPIFVIKTEEEKQMARLALHTIRNDK